MPFDYLRFFEPEYVSAAGGAGFSVRSRYGGDRGITYSFHDGEGVQEVLRVENDLLLILCDSNRVEEATQKQIVTEGDWIHIQFRLSGRSQERIGGRECLAASPGTCIISRYEHNSIIERKVEQDARWRTACLYFRPSAVSDFFAIPPDVFAEDWRWIYHDNKQSDRSAVFTLNPGELLAARNFFECPLAGDLRRSYMVGKCLEVFSLSIARLIGDDIVPAFHLTGSDRRKISQIYEILVEEMDQQLTLSELARRVGLNRSKLAAGFKEIYGSPVQAYWRDLRLAKAFELLKIDELSIADVAGAVGYSDGASLTRSFRKRFGELPREFRA